MMVHSSLYTSIYIYTFCISTLHTFHSTQYSHNEFPTMKKAAGARPLARLPKPHHNRGIIEPILPGLRMLFASTAPSPCSCRRYFSFPSPMPCSPEHVPPTSIA